VDAAGAVLAAAGPRVGGLGRVCNWRVRSFLSFSAEHPELVGFRPILSAGVRNVHQTMTTTATPPAGADELAARLQAVASCYAEMAELPAWSLTDATLGARMAAALRAQAAADEMVARVAAEADASGVAARAGATSTKAWLIAAHGMSPRAATIALAQGRAMTPRTEATRLAWARGRSTATGPRPSPRR
jgi:hypothetical protein